MILRVGVTGIDSIEDPSPAYPVARSLKQTGRRIHTLSLTYKGSGASRFMRLAFNQSLNLPYPTTQWRAFMRALTEAKLNALIPNMDSELPALVKKQKELADAGILTFLPTPEQFEARSKPRLSPLAKEIGIRYPQTALIQSERELKRLLARGFRPPVLIKGHQCLAKTARDLSEASYRFREIFEVWGAPILVQKRVLGEELSIMGLGDGKGGVLGLVAIRKLATTSMGKVAMAVSIRHEALEKAARRFVSATRWRGPFDLECIEGKGRIHLIEINARFPGWVYFGTALGINLPAMLLDCVQGKRVTAKNDYPTGKIFIRYTEELVSDIFEMSGGKR